jgi:hypothetical protein
MMTVSPVRVVATPLVLGVLVLGVLVLGVLVLGCGEVDGVRRYHLQGTVTYDGEPVPGGLIMFEPDREQGNSGPATGAPIRNGVYSLPRDKGIVQGPHRVRINGHDNVPTKDALGEDVAGTPLFPAFETAFDMPPKNSTHDFDVSRQTGK